MRTLTLRWPKSGHFLPIFKKAKERPVIRKYSMSLLIKFAMLKMKINLFSVFMFPSALHWKLSVACFVKRSLHSPP